MFGTQVSDESWEILEGIDDESLKIMSSYALGALKKITRGSEKNRYFRALEVQSYLEENESRDLYTQLYQNFKHLDKDERWLFVFRKLFSEDNIIEG